MSNKPKTLYGNSREMLEAAERKNELLAQIAGETYTNENNPATLYNTDKALLAAANKENELLEAIAEGAGTISGANKLAIDYGTDVLSLKKGDTAIDNSGVTLPAYGISFDSSTGGLTLTKNGTALSGQTVTIPNYGSPVAVEDSTDMTDHDKIYLYEGTTGETYTNGHFYYWDGAAWADGGEYAAATVQTDKTLLVEDRAADSKKVGDEITGMKSGMDQSTIEVSGYITEYDITRGAYIGSQSGKESTGSAPKYAHTQMIDVYGSIYAVRVDSAVYEYYVSYYGANGEIVNGTDYIGWTTVIPVNSGAVLTRIPAGVKKIVINFKSQSTIAASELPDIAASVTVYRYVKDEVEIIDDILMDPNQYIPIKFTIAGTGSINALFGNVSSSITSCVYTDFIDVSDFEAVLYRKTGATVSTAVHNNGMAFYASKSADNFVTGYLASFRQTQAGYLGEMELAYVPYGASYARFTVLKDTDTYGDFRLYGIPKVRDIPLGLHMMPHNSGVYNAIRNARKNSDLRWTPAMDIPRTCIAMRTYNLDSTSARTYVEDKFAAGTEYSGLPYSTTLTYGPGKYLMSERPLDVFLSSVLCEDSAEGELSAYDETYGSYYGNNCTSMVSYAINHPHVSSGSVDNIDGMRSVIGAIVDGTTKCDLSLIRLGDVLFQSAHVAMITDIVRNSNKSVKAIEVTEQTRGGMMNKDTLGGKYGGKTRRLFWSPDAFYAQFGAYAVYRYGYLDHVKYVPSPYSPMSDEGESYNCYDYPLLPYYGNKILLASGATCKLLVRASGFTHVFVTKNGSAWNENGTSDPYVLNGADYVDIQCDSDEAVYAAVLGTLSSGSIFKNTVECVWFVEGTPYVATTIIPKEESGLSYDQVTFTVGMKLGEFSPWYTNLTTREEGDSFYLTKNRLLFDDATLTYDDTASYPYTYTFKVPVRSGTDPSTLVNYRVGMWSDQFGAMYIDGTF